MTDDGNAAAVEEIKKRFVAIESGEPVECDPIGMHEDIGTLLRAYEAVERQLLAEQRDRFSSVVGPCEIHKKPMSGCVRCLIREHIALRAQHDAVVKALTRIVACTRADGEVGDRPHPKWFIADGSGPEFTRAIQEARGLL